MKQTVRFTTLALALFIGLGSTALGNGTETPRTEEAPLMQESAPPPPAPEMPMPREEPSLSGPYVSGSAGVGIAGNEGVKTGYVLNGAVGYNFNPLRLEAAVGYQRHDLKHINGRVSYLSFMANGYYDFEAGYGVMPYLMAGMGVAIADRTRRSDDSSFAWQVGTGIGVKIADRTMFDLGYRYFRPDNGGLNLESHNIMAGIRYQF